jgi:hypothetical protein
MVIYKKNNNFTKLLSWNRRGASKARLWRVLLGKIRAQKLFLRIVIRQISNIKVNAHRILYSYKIALITEHLLLICLCTRQKSRSSFLGI